jgi:hypothetical protein
MGITAEVRSSRGSRQVRREWDEAKADFNFDAGTDEVVARHDVGQETRRAGERPADACRALEVPHGAGPRANVKAWKRCKFLCLAH